MTAGRPRAKGFRRVERWFVGLVMAAIAFALEKAVARALRKGAEPTAAPEEGTFATSRGPDVDAG